MASLRATQEWMAELLRRPSGLPRDRELSELSPLYVTGNAHLSPVEQLEIYREQFWFRHTASLVDDFPGLRAVLGREQWETLITGYLGEVTSTSWSLRNLGYRLPAHVEKATWLPHHELCADMARLEWAYIELFDAADVPPVDPELLSTIPEDAWEKARIVLSPTVSVLRVGYPVAEFRQRLMDVPLHPGEASNALTERVPACLVLYRGENRNSHHVAVPEAAFELLLALREGVPLGAACERAALRVPSEAALLGNNLGEWFSDWGRRGWVVNVETL